MNNLRAPLDGVSNLPFSEDRLFISKEDGRSNAELNWHPDKFSLYIIGYKDAADLLVESLEQGRESPDTLVYPILFLYRHYLELFIKYLIRHSKQLQDEKGDFDKNHTITQLWIECHRLIQTISPNDSVDELKEITRLIGEFSKIDTNSFSFRYPEDRNGKPSLPNDITHINLNNVREVVGKIHTILLGADCIIDMYQGIKNDF